MPVNLTKDSAETMRSSLVRAVENAFTPRIEFVGRRAGRHCVRDVANGTFPALIAYRRF